MCRLSQRPPAHFSHATSDLHVNYMVRRTSCLLSGCLQLSNENDGPSKGLKRVLCRNH